jgi:hypothetical protein
MPLRQNILATSKIWRYMNFTKFVSMLETQSLYFCRTDLLEDKLEGSNSRINATLDPEIAYKDRPGFIGPWRRMRADQSRHFLWQLKWTWVNCWHANEHESMAMWKIYSNGNESIAIQSNFKTLQSLLPRRHLEVEAITYLDHASEPMSEGSTLYPLLHKGMAYDYEKEVRAIIYDPPLGKDGWEWERASTEPGRLVPVDLKKLIHAVYIAPSSEPWLRDLVESILIRYGFEKELLRESALSLDPVY